MHKPRFNRIFFVVLVLAAFIQVGCVARSTNANEVGVQFCKFACTSTQAAIIEPGRRPASAHENRGLIKPPSCASTQDACNKMTWLDFGVSFIA